jgi:hypothetical protein
MSNNKSSVIFISPQQHFAELLKEACEYRNIQILPASETYLLNMLNFYIDSRNLFSPLIHDESSERPPDTFAELYLTALTLEDPKNRLYMKILADKALYLSGFFGDSLQKRSVDIDYYMGIGASAYSNLAAWTKEETTAAVYSTISKKFIDYADLLSYISDKSSLQSEQNILKLYERYVKTGSELARDKLAELGVVTPPNSSLKEQLKIKKI